MRLKYLAHLFFIFIILSLSGCTDKNVNKENYRLYSVKKEVRVMLDNYFNEIRKEGLMAEFNYLDSSEQFFWVPPGFDSPINIDSVRTILERNSTTLKKVDFQWDTLNIVPLSRDIATYTGIVKGKLVNDKDHKIRVTMIETGTVIRRSDGWKILCGQSRNLE